MKLKTIMAGLLSAAALVSCANRERVPAFDLSNLDPSVDPAQDFYQYATGGWQKNNPLKPEYSRFGSFDVIDEHNRERLKELFESLATSSAEKGTEERKIADLYMMGLDSVRLNAEGVSPVIPYLQELEAVNDLESFAKASGRLSHIGIGSLYGVYVETDLQDSNSHLLYLGESGLSMGNRDYYLLPEHAALREGLKAYYEKIFTIAGYGDAKTIARDAFDVEMAIAVPYWSMIQQRDVAAQYNPMSTAKVTELYPNLHFDLFCQELGVPAQEKMSVEQLSYFEALNRILGKTSPEALRHYLQAQVLDAACGVTSDEMYSASFDFFSRQMSGIQEQKPRWKRAMNFPNGSLGEAVGKLYVAKYFPPEYKEKMLTIVRNIQTALSEHISKLEWMGDQTKAKAQEKLAAFTVKIGYPDKWKDYSTLEVDPEKSYFENALNVNRWYSDDNLAELSKPVDREKWAMSPQTVNAYYNPTTNEICFPAGILQPPFFNADADDAVNYGAIGAVISHEMTHGFDDQGRLFDKDGNMTDWWTEEDAEAFKAKTAILVEQFNKIEVLPGVFANGSATLGENIADQGGLRIAYTAMENAMNGTHPEPIDGFTAEQRFYLSFANVWAANITDQEIQRRTLRDVHSLGRYRTNASLRNIDTFFTAFNIKEGDPMFLPEQERVIIW